VVVVVVKVECKITSGLPLSCLYSYQRQTGAKPKWRSNLLLSVGNSCKMKPMLTEEYVELWIDTQYDSKD
jgi:hypothetical protein